MGREAIVVSCSRALEYRPRSTYTSARSSRWKMFCGFSATAFSRYVWASPQLPLSRKPPPNSAFAKNFWKPERSEEHTSELQSRSDLVCRLLLEKKKKTITA